MTIDGGLRPLFRRSVPHFFWTSVETGGTGLGIADSHFLAPGGVSGWIEYKQTDGWAVTLRPEQVGFLLRYSRMGGRCWIAVRRRTEGGPRSPAADELWLMPGVVAAEAKAGGLRDPLVAACADVWRGGPARWDWTTVAALLSQ